MKPPSNLKQELSSIMNTCAKNFDLDLYISPTSNNVENYYEDNWEDRDTLFYGGYYMRVDQ